MPAKSSARRQPAKPRRRARYWIQQTSKDREVVWSFPQTPRRDQVEAYLAKRDGRKVKAGELRMAPKGFDRKTYKPKGVKVAHRLVAGL